MANARQSILQDRRAPTLGSGSIRVLTPQNTGISSIAKRNAANESEVMISKYNNGLISNAEMKTFLQGQVNSPYITDSDKIDIQTKLQDFDVLIEKDRLESVFKLAPENSLQKEQAATALAQFYTKRASSMVAGTPAHSQALENAGAWQSTVQSIRGSVNKQQRKNLENSLLQKVNQLPTSSSARSQATAQMYKQLYDMAVSQGDEEDAQVYAAKLEQAQTYADQYGVQEQEQMSKNEIKQFAAEQDLLIAKLTDKTPDELRAKAEKAYAVAEKYAEIGDQLNYTKYLTMATQAEEKYNNKVSSLSGSEMAASWDTNDDEYKKIIKEKQKELSQGKININQYSAGVANVINQRKVDLDSRIEYAESLDPNAKIKVNGRNIRAEDLLQKYYDERDVSSGLGYGDKSEDGGINQKLEDFMSGKVVAVVVPPKEVTKSGSLSLTGSEVAKITFVNSDNLDENDWAVDENGLRHKINREEVQLTPEQAMTAVNGYYTDANGQSSRVLYDTAGNPYVYGQGKKVQTYEPGSSKKVEQEYTGQPVKSYIGFQDEVQTRAEKDFEDQAKAAQINPKVEEQPDVPLIQKISEVTDTILPQGKNVSPIPEKRTLGQQLRDTASLAPIEAGKKILQNLKEPVGDVIENARETIQPVVQTAQNVIGGATRQAVEKITAPQPSAPSNSGSMPITKVVNNVPSVKQYSPTTGFSYQPIAAPKPAPAPQPTTLQKIGTTITGAAGQAVNKLKSLFKW